MDYEIYTDGACSGNPGHGGFAFVVSSMKPPVVIYGTKKETTNNYMELMAIVWGIRHVANLSKSRKFTVTVYSDSAYCINSITQGWIYSWETNGWLTKSGTEVKNEYLWKKYIKLIKMNPGMKVRFVKVKGHSGNKYNEMADKAAKNAIKLECSALPSKGGT